MSVRRHSVRAAVATVICALALAAAPAAHAKATAKCVGTVMTITIKSPATDPLNTTVSTTSASTVAVNAGTADASTETCPSNAAMTSLEIVGTDNGDQVDFSGTLAFTATADLKKGGDSFTATGTQPVSVTGGDDSDALIGGDGSDVLAGGPGDDVLQGGAASDQLQGGLGTNTVSYEDRGPTEGVSASLNSGIGGQQLTMEVDQLILISNLVGGDGADVLTGDSLVNTLIGGAGDDTLVGLGSDDRLLPGAGGGSTDGGSGVDVVSFEDAPVVLGGVTVTARLAAPGSASVAGSTQGLANLENIVGSPGDDVLIGNTANNVLTGGAGKDTVSYADRDAAHDVAASLTSDSGGEAGVDVDSYASIENLTGGAGDDTLIGDDAKNVLDGGAGGSDTASYAGRVADITASLAAGSGGPEADVFLRIDNLTGGLGSDILSGDDANNVLDGGAGGSDTVSYADRAIGEDIDASLVTMTGGDPDIPETDTFVDIDHLIGGMGEDMLSGNGQINRIEGGDGDDTLLGGANDDTLHGDAGDDVLAPGTGVDSVQGGTHGTTGGVHGAAGDIVSYADLAVEIVASLATGSATVSGDAEVLSDVEGLTGGDGDDTLTGTDGADLLAGGPGDDELHPRGGGGSNAGGTHGTAGGAHGAGGDTVSYSDLVALAFATASLAAGTGSVSGATTHAISGVENLTGGPGDDTLTGDTADNRLAGGAGNDTVTYADRGADHDVTASLAANAGGEAGVDADTYDSIENLTGGAGDDTLIGDGAKNVLDGGAGGSDTASYAGRAAAVVASLATGTGGAEGDEYERIDNLTGGNHNDTLAGDDANNVLDGGPGTDTVTYADRGASEDIVASLAATGGQTGTTEADTYANVENLTGGDGDDTLTGDGAANVLSGGLGADRLNGAAGDDRLVPGPGASTLDGGDGSDTVTFAGATAALPPALTLVANLAAGTATVSGDAHGLQNVENVEGTAGDDLLIGDDASNVLDGGSAGSDTVAYSDRGPSEGVAASFTTNTGGAKSGGETDQYAGIDDLVGGAGDDTLTGNGLANELQGLGGADDLAGEAGSDRLLPGLGAGTNDGGAGTEDVASWEDLPDSVDIVASLAAGSASVAGVTQSLTGLEHLTGGAGDDTLIGDHASNDLTGGPGTDTASYADRIAGENIRASLTTGIGGQKTTAEQDVYATIENLTGGSGADELTGDAGANELRGGAGDDQLGGNAGDDLLVPGLGGGSATGGAHGSAGDSVSYAGVSEDVTINLLAGTAAATSITQTLAEVENATGGSGSDTLVGNAANNALDGGAGGSDTVSYIGRAAAVTASLATATGGAGLERDTYANVEHLTGGNGSDTLSGDDANNTLDGGAAGSDTVSYADREAGEDILASLESLTGGDPDRAETDTFVSIRNLTSGKGEDTLTGDGLANRLDGGDGDDTLRGRGASDELRGDGGDDVLWPSTGADIVTGGSDGTAGGAHGDGGDIASYADLAIEIVASLTDGQATVGGQTQTLAELEGVTGGAGDDTLTGGPGIDTLDGGPGDDLLHPRGRGTNVGGTHGTAGGAHGDGGDTVSYADLVAPAFATATLAPGPGSGSVSAGSVHTIASVENLTGGPGDDTLTGDGAVNVLEGGEGNDTVSGGGGADMVRGAGGADILAGDDGDDTLEGAAGNDILGGGAGADSLQGAAGGDTLTGGLGPDLMDGGTGSDRASYAANGPTEGVYVSLDGLPNDGTGGGGEKDEVIGTENVAGGAGADTLVGNQGVNDLRGEGGDDVIVGGGGNDTLDGSGGTDTLSYEDRGAGESVTVALNATGGANGEFDSSANFEALLGGHGDDRLTGSGAADVIFGSRGADVVSGAGGDDTLWGDDGDDTLAGGPGADDLRGNLGNDRLDGGSEIDAFNGAEGDDDISAFDGTGEAIVCGTGDDRADHDLVDGFPLADCESRVLLGYVPPPFALDPRPRDRDRDGAFAGPDCNDLDPTIGPAAPDVPGNGIDENCDKADAPFPAVATDVRRSFARGPGGTRIRVFELRKVPANATIEIRCTSKRAPRCVFSKRTRTIGARRAKVSIRGYFGDRPLSRGSRVEVRVLAPRTIGKVLSFTMGRPGATPRLITRCLPPGATTPVVCT